MRKNTESFVGRINVTTKVKLIWSNEAIQFNVLQSHCGFIVEIDRSVERKISRCTHKYLRMRCILSPFVLQRPYHIGSIDVSVTNKYRMTTIGRYFEPHYESVAKSKDFM